MPNKPNIIVIGIDGACWDYIDPLLSEGKLPHLAQLCQDGLRGNLHSTVPAITPVAWSSFITGKNPGKHGLFDFLVEVGDKDQLVPFSSTCRCGTSFWKYLGNQGLLVGVIGIPVTYPPEAVNGFMISGFGSPEGSSNVMHPPGLMNSIEKKYGTYNVLISDHLAKTEGLNHYLTQTLENEAKQTKIALDLAEEYRLDFLAINYQSADEFNHYAPDFSYVERILVGIDQNIGCIVRKYPNTNFIVLSDHGSRRLKGEFLLRNWLFKQGFVNYYLREIDTLTRSEINHILVSLLQDNYLRKGSGEKVVRGLLSTLFNLLPKSGKKRYLDSLLEMSPYDFFFYQYTDRIDWDKTQIYDLSGHGGLYVNSRNKKLGKDEYETLRNRFIELFSAIKEPLSGNPLVQRIYKKEEIYQGPFLDMAPDLVADCSQSTYAFKAGGFAENVYKSSFFVETSNNFGAHTLEGIFVFCGKDFKQASFPVESASILDIPATILHLFGTPIPEDFDGRVLTEYISNEFMAVTPIRFQKGDGEMMPHSETPFSSDEIKELEGRLRDLGYIG